MIAGGIAGGVAGGFAMDGLTTVIDSGIHKEFKPNGYVYYILVFIENI